MILKPPSPLPVLLPSHRERPLVFLAGSIEQGTAPDWQAEAAAVLDEQGCDVLNPRRDGWDPTWEQKASNLQFRAQVEWELDGLGISDAILMYFAPNTKSPITLLELGLFAGSDKLFVCCPDGFWRKGNVDIVCDRSAAQTFDTLPAMVDAVLAFLKNEARGR